jgi:hypothetical protein
LTWGILAIMGMFIGLIPCIGALNWLNIPFAVVGLIVSLVSHSSQPSLNRTGSLIGIILCVLAIVIGFKRLVLGGGII